MKKFIIASAALAPTFAFAAYGQLDGIFSLMKSIGRLVDLALPLVVGIALLGFFWGLARFIFAKGDEAARAEARSTMIYGIIALFVMVSVWGLVRFVGNALGIDQGGTSGPVPGVQGL